MSQMDPGIPRPVDPTPRSDYLLAPATAIPVGVAPPVHGRGYATRLTAAVIAAIIVATGDVLTNNHVVEGSISISVVIQGRSGTYTAQVLGVDPTDDVAVIHINGVSGLPVVTLADSSALQVGDAVLAIGNALGLGGTPRVTQGQITALNQSITASENGTNSEQLTGMIQSDAEIS